jgi:hypothetical protein
MCNSRVIYSVYELQTEIASDQIVELLTYKNIMDSFLDEESERWGWGCEISVCFVVFSPSCYIDQNKMDQYKKWTNIKKSLSSDIINQLSEIYFCKYSFIHSFINIYLTMISIRNSNFMKSSGNPPVQTKISVYQMYSNKVHIHCIYM